MVDMLELQIHEIEHDLRRDRAPPGRLPGADDPVRGRGADRPDASDRTRGRHANVQLAQSRPVRRGSTSACTAPIRPAASASSPAKAHRPLRWALYEAAQSATRHASPDYADYHALKARGLTHTRASLTIARKIARRSYHLLHTLGPAALEPVPEP